MYITLKYKNKMGQKLFLLLAVVGLSLFSCKNTGNSADSDDELTHDAIVQQQDGTISLDVKEATTYHDVDNPESNTAEWNVIVSKKGRYDVWLSSATKDPGKLAYHNSVMVSIRDNQLEARPSIDKVIPNSSDGSYPFTTDSFMGSLFISDTGLFNIQVVSDKILPKDAGKNSQADEGTKLISVSLTPVTD
jgi:hypothetical protein